MIVLLMLTLLAAAAGVINVPPRGRHHTPAERPRARRAETLPALEVAHA